MAVKKTATKATKAPAKKAEPKTATKKPAAKKAAPKAKDNGIEVIGGGAMGNIVDEALKSKYYKAVQADIKTLFKQEEIDDTDIQTLLCKTFVQGVISGAAIAADEAQKGFEELAKMLQKMSNKK
ncbi:MAG: hypothetical protein MJY93_07640 [Fibrobacter sp.]|nr:hypothetical protein [Fibrobacter sp.]